MSHNRGLTVVEMLVTAIGIIALLALLYIVFGPALGNGAPAYRMQNNTQLRGIHMAMLMYADDSNTSFFPGLDSTGQPAALDVEDRLKLLIDTNYFTPEYVISPLEGRRGKQEWTAGPFTSDHYSYALLQIPAAGGRYDEWQDTRNPDAIVMSDRNTGTTASPESLQSETAGNWRGGVVRNDNSVSFETTHLHDTAYAGHAHLDDHLFEAAGDDDAYLIHSGN